MNEKGITMKNIYYYTLENNDGHIYMGTNTKRLAKKMIKECSNEGICYKRKVGDKKYCKFMFIW